MKAGPRDPGIVDGAIAGARGWFRGAALSNLCGVMGLVLVFRAISALIGADLHPTNGQSTDHWLVLGGVGLLCQVVFATSGGHLAARGSNRVEQAMRRRLVGLIYRHDAPVVSPPVAARVLLEGSRNVADASERWEPIRLQAVLVPAALGAVVLATNWLVGALVLLAAPLIPLNMAMFGMGADRISRRQANQVAELDEMVLDRIKGAGTLRTLSSVATERRRIRDAADQLANCTLGVLRVALLSSAALEGLVTYAVAVSATYIGLVLLGYVRVGWAPTHLNLADGIFLLLLAPTYFQPFRDLAAAYHDRKDVSAVTETLALELSSLDQASAARTDGVGPVTQPGRPQLPAQGVVEAEAVTLRYPGATVDAVHEVDWFVPIGAVAGVAGASGSGKSTLLRLATGRLSPSRGTVTRAEGPMAWVNQRPYFFQASIAENLLLGRATATKDELWESLASVGLADEVRRAPGALDSPIGWDGSGLSGGQASRLALARALLSGSRTLVLDEPTAHLDPLTEEELLDTILALAPERTIIMASHSHAVLLRCTQVLTLDAVRVEELLDAP
jgi:ATP-binding cassette subfamily C protein CydD